MITVLHGGYAQMITILHRGDYVICARPLFCVIRVINRSTGCPKKMKTKWCWSPKIPTKIECSLAKFSHGYDLQKKNWDGLPSICLKLPVARCAGCRLRRWTVPPPPPLPHRALELGDEGQLRFWHFPSFLWTEIASAIPEWSIKSLFWWVKWHCPPKNGSIWPKKVQFSWNGMSVSNEHSVMSPFVGFC